VAAQTTELPKCKPKPATGWRNVSGLISKQKLRKPRIIGWEESVSILQVNGKDYTKPELLVYWILEREQIRVLKEHDEPKPWSTDWVFQETYFCNVHREDDRVTRWIRDNYKSEYFQNYELAMVAARIFNWPPTLAAILGWLRTSDLGYVEGILRGEQERGRKIWGGAYVITTHGQKMPKLDYCIGVLTEAARRLPLVDVDTCRGYHVELQRMDGIGSFLSAQIIADLKNTPNHPLAEAEDWWTFSAPGPGSLRGLAWFHDRRVTARTYQQDIEEVAQYVRPRILDTVGDIHMQDLQNCLCEFDKYCRVLTGTGRSKRKYPGKT
jgi:hypothetical protein